jgi:outer membrane protein OmpA-like peptidoglycan-associated protein
MNTGGLIKDAEVLMFDSIDNQLSTTHSDAEGNFLVQTKFAEQVVVKVRHDGFLMNAKDFSFSVNDESFERKHDFYLQRIEVGKVFALKNVLFAQGNADLLSESFFELNKLADMMKDNPKIEIELAGHTDNSGTTEKNLILSEDRVNSVKKYLINRGISETRITGKGYGGEFPIASNNSDLTRRLNRRVEFKIVKM